MFGVTSKGLTKITCYVDKKPIKFEKEEKEPEKLIDDDYITQLLSNLK